MIRIRMALVLLAGWVSVSVVVWLVAGLNFRTADRVSTPGGAPPLEAHLAARGAGAAAGAMAVSETRPVVRFLASELNRAVFRSWGALQLALAAVLIALVASEPAVALWGKVAAFAGSGLAVVLGLVLRPRIARLGPPLDFVPRPVPAEFEEAHRAFFRAHGAYVSLDLLKAALLVAALIAVLRVRERSRYGDIGPGA